MEDKFLIRFSFEGKEHQAIVTLVSDTISESGYPEYHIHLDNKDLIDRFKNDRVLIHHNVYFKCMLLPVPDDEIFMKTIQEALTESLNQPDTFK